jgi:type IV secretion system protein VirD4
MPNRLKALLGVLLLLICFTLGLYLSGWILLSWLKLTQVPLEIGTYWRYVRALDLAKVAPFAFQIKVSGYIGFGLPLLLYLGVMVLLSRSRGPALHGTARFAGSTDLSKQGFYRASDTSIVVGKKDGKLLHYSGQQFAILAAPTRSGKGVGIVIPNLLSYQGSVVVLDIKQENFDLTSGYRQSIGQSVYLFNPFAEDGKTHRWNPLSYVSSEHHQRVSDLMSIAAMLYPDVNAEQKFWVAQARNAFLAFALYLFEQHQHLSRWGMNNANTQPTLGNIYRLSSSDGTDLKTYFSALSQQSFLSESCQTAFSGLLSQAEETFSSIMGTFKEPLNPWVNPMVDAATSGDDFLLTDVRKRKMSIYIGILPNKLAESRLIVNLFFSQLINLNTKELPNPELPHQCLLLMDEFTSIGKVEIIATAVSYMAGYNLRLLPIIQSMAQLDAVYGKEHARTLITNHALQILYAPREQQDANDYSEMLGYTTVRKESVSKGKSERTVSEHEERRALMLPQELKAMGADKEVFLYEGLPHPVLCEKIRYYQDKHFTQRLKGKVQLPVLDFKAKPAQASAIAKPATMSIQPPPSPEEDAMNLKQLTAASLITASTLTTSACEPIKQVFAERNSAGEVIVTGPEFDITPNPNPQKKYTLHVQIKDAPQGGFKRASAWVYFDVENVKECGYRLGWPYDGTVPAIERSIAFPLKQLNNTEYEGTFYTDWGKDGDFFGNGVCHWRFRNVGASFGATGADGETSFGLAFHNTGAPDEVFAVNKPLQKFYLKEDYPAFAKIPNYSSIPIGNINYFKPEDIFSITINVQEAQ